MKTNTVAKISSILLILIASFSGCQKSEEMNSGEKMASVKVNLTGISDEESSTKGTEKLAKQITQLDDGVSLVSSIIQEKASTQKTVQNLPDGTTYRVIVYKNSVSASNWVTSKQFSVGTTTDNIFSLASGGSYIFVCYSLNNTSDLPFDGSTGTVLNGIDGNVDLLYKQVTMNITDGTGPSQNVLEIVFAHAFSRIKVKFNSEIGNITALSNLSFSPHYASANLNLAAPTTLTYNGSAGSKNFTLPTTLGSTLAETGYTLFCLPSSAGTLLIGSITVNGITKNNLTLNYNIAPGKSYTITLTLTGLTAYGVTWAPGNLVYNPATGVYSFTTADGYGDYWFYNFLKPKIIGTSDTYQAPSTENNGGPGDPCSKVLPENTWHLPTTSEMNNLITATNSTGASSGWQPIRYQAAHYYSNTTAGDKTNPGLFLGIQVHPETKRANYLFLPFAGGYYNSNENNTVDLGLFLVSGGTYYLQAGNIYTLQFINSTPNNAFPIRCVKSTN